MMLLKTSSSKTHQPLQHPNGPATPASGGTFKNNIPHTYQYGVCPHIVNKEFAPHTYQYGVWLQYQSNYFVANGTPDPGIAESLNTYRHNPVIRLPYRPLEPASDG